MTKSEPIINFFPNILQLAAGKNICVTGVVVEYKGKPEIVVSDPKQIEAKD